MTYTAKELAECATRIDNDVYGNPRYYFPYVCLMNITDKQRSACGLSKYRGKKFGAGYVMQSYNLEFDCQHIVEVLAR